MATFGDTGTGGSASIVSSYAYFIRFQMAAENGSVTSLSWYLNSTAGANVKFAIFADNATAPGVVLGSKAGTVGAGAATATLTRDTPVAVTASSWYWLAARADAATNCYYATAAYNGGRVNVTYADFPADSPTFNATYTDRLFHAYATYTPASGNAYYYQANQ